MADIKIVPYADQYKADIKTLNYEWLQRYFVVEPVDIEQLSDPKSHIIDKGGHIYFAQYNDEIVGTSSLLKVDVGHYELAKMAVTEKYKGLGIGKILIEHCINEAKLLNAQKLSLYSNTTLTAAIHLYKIYGFVEVPLPTAIHYERADIMMEKYL